MNGFLLGALCMGFGITALYFLRFWRETRDRFFAWFSVAFGVMSLNQVALMMFGEQAEFDSWIYGVRLLAFVIILVAVLDKNRSQA